MDAGGAGAAQAGGTRKKTSKHRGVRWLEKLNKWQAQININGKNKCLGFSDSEEAAARMYDTEARPLGRAVNFRVHATDRTVAEELAARPPRPEHPFHGVYFKSGKWTAEITIDGKNTFLGRHATPELAAHAWDAKATQHGRTDLNFPPPGASGGAKQKRAALEGDDTAAATKRARVAQQPPKPAPAASAAAVRAVATQTPGAYAKAMARLAAAEKAVAALQAEMRALRAKLAKKAKASGA